MTNKKTFFNWSTGKDSAFALYKLLKADQYHVGKLITSVNKDFERVTMHGLRLELLQRQLDQLNIPCDKIELSEKTSMKEYEEMMRQKLESLKGEGYEYAAFGDIFLEDLKEYREKQLSSFGIKAVFPIWKENTKELLRDFIQLGFKTIVVCINGSKLDKSFCGRVIDESFINDLPDDVDPCGENGEFHTFCFDGPIFNNPIPFQKGDLVKREYPDPENPELKHPYWFCDLV